jgi:hypothetical protein
VARLLISGPKRDSCPFRPWRARRRQTRKWARAARRRSFTHERSRSGSARTNGKCRRRTCGTRDENRTAPVAGGESARVHGLGFEERSGFGAAQLRVEADTARRRPAGRAGSSTHKVGGRHAARNFDCASPSATRAIAGSAPARIRRAASASARGPRPCSLTRAVGLTASLTYSRKPRMRRVKNIHTLAQFRACQARTCLAPPPGHPQG